MTDEILATESLLRYRKEPKWAGKMFMKDENTCYKDGFLAGLKAGRPQWHKMDYNDEKSFENIPRYIELLTKYSCGLFEAHCINKWTGDHWCEHSYGVIAWCELPTFDKE